LKPLGAQTMQILRRPAKAKSDQQDVIRGIRQTPENVKFLDESAIAPAGDGRKVTCNICQAITLTSASTFFFSAARRWRPDACLCMARPPLARRQHQRH
jgi:hypothetical protein